MVVSLLLVVDDERSGLYFRKLILEHAGHSVLSATNVEEAMQLFRSNAVDLVITDHLLGRKTVLGDGQRNEACESELGMFAAQSVISYAGELHYQ